MSEENTPPVDPPTADPSTSDPWAEILNNWRARVRELKPSELVMVIAAPGDAGLLDLAHSTEIREDASTWVNNEKGQERLAELHEIARNAFDDMIVPTFRMPKLDPEKEKEIVARLRDMGLANASMPMILEDVK